MRTKKDVLDEFYDTLEECKRLNKKDKCQAVYLWTYVYLYSLDGLIDGDEYVSLTKTIEKNFDFTLDDWDDIVQ